MTYKRIKTILKSYMIFTGLSIWEKKKLSRMDKTEVEKEELV